MTDQGDSGQELARQLRDLVETGYRRDFTFDGLATKINLSRRTVTRALDPLSTGRTARKTVEAFTAVFCEDDAERTERLIRLQESAWSASEREVSNVAEGMRTAGVQEWSLWAEFARPPDGLADDLLVAEFACAIELLTRDFVGRSGFVEAVDRAIADPAFRSGYVLVTGEPGIGKSSLMAHLVRTRGWLHHFNSVSGFSTTEDFLRNVCAQVIIRYQLKHTVLPPRAGQNSMFLRGLLSDAARQQEAPVVIAVDAIDEASDSDRPQGSNRLSLPAQLPDNVYVVVTSRGRNVYELDAQSVRHIEIEDRSEANLADLSLYVTGFVERHAERMAPLLRSAEKRGVDFTAAFLDRSDGNFLYAARVLPEIVNRGLSEIDDVHALPLGLREYYRRHWAAMRAADPVLFDELHRPVIEAFGLLNETSAQVIADTWDLPVDRVRRAIGIWREFLNEADAHAGLQRYRIYHKSFLDFLWSEVDLRGTQRRMVKDSIRRVAAGRSHGDRDDLDDLDSDDE
ncbi:ATP-binding protein [Streptomyces sp. NPDC006530]|uniref:ATP-binding protein n=1 Tax=Streptomyces sp. NPDC006530 TaxID=3364750 RepID=UPI003698C9F7